MCFSFIRYVIILIHIDSSLTDQCKTLIPAQQAQQAQSMRISSWNQQEMNDIVNESIVTPSLRGQPKHTVCTLAIVISHHGYSMMIE